MPPVGSGDQCMVGDQIVHIAGAHGAGIAEVADLDGSGPLGKDAGAIVFGEPLQVHCNVHFELAAEFGDLPVVIDRTSTNRSIADDTRWFISSSFSGPKENPRISNRLRSCRSNNSAIR